MLEKQPIYRQRIKQLIDLWHDEIEKYIAKAQEDGDPYVMGKVFILEQKIKELEEVINAK